MVNFLGRLSSDIQTEVAAPTGALYDWFFSAPDGLGTAPYLVNFSQDGEKFLWQDFDGSNKLWLGSFRTKEFFDIGAVTLLSGDTDIVPLLTKDKVFILDAAAESGYFASMVDGSLSTAFSITAYNNQDASQQVPISRTSLRRALINVSPDERYIGWCTINKTAENGDADNAKVYIVDTESESIILEESVANPFSGDINHEMHATEFKWNYSSDRLGVIFVSGMLADNDYVSVTSIFYDVSDGVATKAFTETGSLHSYDPGGGIIAPETPYTRFDFSPTSNIAILFNDAQEIARAEDPETYVYETDDSYWTSPTEVGVTPYFYARGLNLTDYSTTYEYSRDCLSYVNDIVSDSNGGFVFFIFNNKANLENNISRFCTLNTSDGSVAFPSEAFILDFIEDVDDVYVMADSYTWLKDFNDEGNAALWVEYDATTNDVTDLYRIGISSITEEFIYFGGSSSAFTGAPALYSIRDGNKVVFDTYQQIIDGNLENVQDYIIIKDNAKTDPVVITMITTGNLTMFPAHAPLPE